MRDAVSDFAHSLDTLGIRLARCKPAPASEPAVVRESRNMKVSRHLFY